MSVIVSLYKGVSRLCSVIPLWQALYFGKPCILKPTITQHYLFSLVAFIPEVVSVVDFVLIFGVILLVKGLEWKANHCASIGVILDIINRICFVVTLLEEILGGS